MNHRLLPIVLGSYFVAGYLPDQGLGQSESSYELVPELSDIDCQATYQPYSVADFTPNSARSASVVLSRVNELVADEQWQAARSWIMSALEKKDQPLNENESLHQKLHELIVQLPDDVYMELQSQMDLYSKSLEGGDRYSDSKTRVDRGFAFLQTNVGLDLYLHELAVLHDKTVRDVKYLSYRYKLLKLRRDFPNGINPGTLVRAMYVHGYAGDHIAVREFANAASASNKNQNTINISSTHKLDIEKHKEKLLEIADNQQFSCQSLDVGVIGEVLLKHRNQLVIQQKNLKVPGSKEPEEFATTLWRTAIDPSTGKLLMEKPLLMSRYEAFQPKHISISPEGQVGLQTDPRLNVISSLDVNSGAIIEHFYGTLANDAKYLGYLGGKNFGYYNGRSGLTTFIAELSNPGEKLVTFKRATPDTTLEQLIQPMDEGGCFVTKSGSPSGKGVNTKKVFYKHYKFDGDGRAELLSEITLDKKMYLYEYYSSKTNLLVVRSTSDYMDNKGDQIRVFKFGGCQPDVEELSLPIPLDFPDSSNVYFSESGYYFAIDAREYGSYWIQYDEELSGLKLVSKFDKSLFSQKTDLYGKFPAYLIDARQIVLSERGGLLSYVNQKDQVVVSYQLEDGSATTIELKGLSSQTNSYLMPIAFIGDRILLVADYKGPYYNSDTCDSDEDRRVLANKTYAVYLPDFMSSH